MSPEMRIANLLLFAAAIVVGVSLAYVIVSDPAPLLPYLGSNFTGDEVNVIGYEFWKPVVNAFVSFVDLAVPVALVVAITMFAERQLFAKRATFHTRLCLVLWFVVAVPQSIIDFNYYLEAAIVYTSIGLYAGYSLWYQVSASFRTHRKESAKAVKNMCDKAVV